MQTITSKRILSIDILRGLVMVIMALDHCRDYFHGNVSMMNDPMNPETTFPFLYFTRWITHFCAPTFVFLSGISAYLSAKNKTPKQASNFLFKRGLWLILVEVVLITFGLTFNPFYNVIILQVIWAIGCSMLLLAIFSRISYKAVLCIGLLLFFGHNLLNYFSLPPADTLNGGLISAFITGQATFLPIGDNRFILVLYTVLPWTGAMFLGYAIGKWYESGYDEIKRRKQLILIGLSLTVGFLFLRYFNLYGNPTPRIAYEDFAQTIYSFFNVSKYPPSLQYYGMTLGPALLLLALLEKSKNWFSKILMAYGNVPFFYYVLHFYLIHFVLVILFYLHGYGAKDIADPQSPFLFRPTSFGYSLPIVYLIWLLIVATLYKPCIWFKNYKLTHQQWWLKYL
ncbi:MAG: DUF1624 domain-containing protein [Flavobacterium sp.]|nr:MAG: DUF1624 domain-containing protein [Flavobacterium sp.]